MLIKSAKVFAQGVLDFAFPPKCLSCRAAVEKHGHICSTCWDTINIIGLHKCHSCSLPFDIDQGKKAICQHCRETKPRYDRAMAFCTHDGVARKLVLNLKFGDSLHLAPPMAKMMHIMGEELVRNADLIAPVPLHFRRKMGRKYNQAALLGKNIAKVSAKTYDPFLLKRTRHTKQQTRLSKSERQKNVAGAFAVRKNASVKGKTVLLIDDVMTTGSTISACARILKEHGARKVYCLVFARTLAF